MTKTTGEPRRTITIERTYRAPIEDLWDLWTTKEGIEFHPGPLGVKMVLTIDAMHDEQWTNRAVMGWESELGKLAQALAA